MYASITRCQPSATGSSTESTQTGRVLANLVSGLPGFVAFVALDVEDEGIVSLMLFDDQASIEAANRRLTDWNGADADRESPGRNEIVWGEVIAQKGL